MPSGDVVYCSWCNLERRVHCVWHWHRCGLGLFVLRALSSGVVLCVTHGVRRVPAGTGISSYRRTVVCHVPALRTWVFCGRCGLCVVLAVRCRKRPPVQHIEYVLAVPCWHICAARRRCVLCLSPGHVVARLWCIVVLPLRAGPLCKHHRRHDVHTLRVHTWELMGARRRRVPCMQCVCAGVGSGGGKRNIVPSLQSGVLCALLSDGLL